MRMHLKKEGLKAAQQHSIQVVNEGIVVGDYVADLLVEELVLVELKAVKELDEVLSPNA